MELKKMPQIVLDMNTFNYLCNPKKKTKQLIQQLINHN